MSQQQVKTQILITDIPKDKFTQKWPSTIEKLLFETKFPELRSKLQYFTPLPFLQRIIIILDDSQSAHKLYDFLKDGNYINKPLKIFLTESLLVGSNPRARSFDDSTKTTNSFDKITNPFLDLARPSRVDNNNNNNDTARPILSLETDPLKTGVTSNSLCAGSPSLSPDNGMLESPTLLKFDKDDKPHYYKEPLPKTNSNSSLNLIITPVASGEKDKSKTPFNTIPRDQVKITSSDEDLNYDERNGSTPSISTPPKSPSITINPVFP